MDELLETMPEEEIAERIALDNLRADPRSGKGKQGDKQPPVKKARPKRGRRRRGKKRGR